MLHFALLCLSLHVARRHVSDAASRYQRSSPGAVGASSCLVTGFARSTHQPSREARMAKTPSAAGFKPSLFLLLCRQSAGATVRRAMLMRPMLILIVALLAASPNRVSATTPDSVLEWIDVMNT